MAGELIDHMIIMVPYAYLFFGLFLDFESPILHNQDLDLDLPVVDLIHTAVRPSLCIFLLQLFLSTTGRHRYNDTKLYS